jgi:hypothetical protein
MYFREMDIEWEPNCGDDFMSLHDGHNMTARVLRGLVFVIISDLPNN